MCKFRQFLQATAIMPALVVAGGCSDDIPVISLGLEDTYTVYRMQKLPLTPALTGESYRWTDSDGNLLSTDPTYIFVADREGEYGIVLEIADKEGSMRFDMKVRVVHEEVEYSPYISRVFDYHPAPGQYVNTMPEYTPGDSYVDMLAKVEESLTDRNDGMVSLGGFGGYVTFGFDHTVINRPGEFDLRLWGNSIYELTGNDRKGGSSEPGIVMVSFDRNCNGIPDDEWYEIAGSEYDNPATKRNYSITYHRPDPERTVIRTGNITDRDYIKWDDSEGNSSFISKTAYHSQDYFPGWVEDQTLSFTGNCLPSNGEDVSGTGAYFILYCLEYGYADNHPNDYAAENSFDISWAVDRNGLPAALPGIDFVRVYTGMNQQCGWLGETSTEICRGMDLHIEQ